MTTIDDPAGPFGGGTHGLLDPRRAQPLPPAERHHPVAAAGDLPGAAGELRAHLHPDRLPALRLPVHRLALAAGGRALHRQAADVPPLHRRHGGEPDRPPHPRLRQPLLGAARRGHDASASARRSSTPTARGSRAPPRAAATASRSPSSRWAATPAARSGRCSPPMSCCPSASTAIAWFSALALLGMIVLWNVGTWALARHREARGDRQRRAAGRVSVFPPRKVVAIIGVLALLVFTKYIYVASLIELLHLLPDRAVRGQRARRAAPALRLPRRRRRRHLRRRPDRRPDRPQGGDLGLDPRRAAVQPGAALTPTSSGRRS